jgi:uncharacterized beta-barrel protein YwiB (DUF1934 family)
VNNRFSYNVNAVSGTLRKSHPKSKFCVRDVNDDLCIFNKEKPSISRYHTGQGIFEIKIDTKKLDIIKHEGSMDIIINYDINIVDLFEGYNNIKIEVQYK